MVEAGSVGMAIGEQENTPGMKTRYPAARLVMRKGYFCCFFDIVNGFLIDAVVHWFASRVGPQGSARRVD